MIIKNAKIYTMENKEIIENGFIEFKDGIITKISDMNSYKKGEEEEIDARGMLVFPGFIDAHCHLGMIEDSLTFEGDDVNELNDPLTPQLRAIDAINPMDICFKEAREAGVTTVVTGPGSSNVIAGTFCAIKTSGICVDDMVIKNDAAMKFSFGENPKSTYNGKKQLPMTRMSSVALIREQLKKALAYKEDLKESKNGKEKPSFDFKCESLLPLLNREIPMKAHAHRADDIFSAIRIAKEFNLKLTLDHCTEGHLIVDKLKNLGYHCLVGPSLTCRTKPELKNKSYKTPKILSDAGIDVSIITDHDVIPIEHLALCASLAYKEGMDYIKALEAITINPAKCIGIDDKVGSLKEGKHADIIVFDSDPLNTLCKPILVFIDGKKI